MDIFHQYLDDCLLIYNNLFVFSDLEPSIISILYGYLEYMATLDYN